MPRELERIALISDVHGNLTALEAVLADIDARGIDRIFNLGDYVGKGPRGREVIDLCRERCEVNILGNWDDFRLTRPDRVDTRGAAWWLASCPGQGEWLRPAVQPRLRDERAGPALPRLGGHRAPPGPFRPRRGGVPRHVRQHPGDRRRTEPDVVGYGDTHDPYYEVDRERRTLFNTGSVGNCMDDPTPVYVILEGVQDDEAPFSIQFVRVPATSRPSGVAARWACRSWRRTSSNCARASTAATCRW